MATSDRRAAWVRATTGSPGDVLASGIGLDVWERSGDAFLVVAEESALLELERRHIASVCRIGSAVDIEGSGRQRPGEDRP